MTQDGEAQAKQSLASLAYVSVDDVVVCALKEGKGALLAKNGSEPSRSQHSSSPLG